MWLPPTRPKKLKKPKTTAPWDDPYWNHSPTKSLNIFTSRKYYEMRRRCGKPLPFKESDLLHLYKEALMGAYCPYCLDPLTIYNMVVDHVLPVCSGGSYQLSNLEVICIPCNKLKSKYSPAFLVYALEANQRSGVDKHDIRIKHLRYNHPELFSM